MGGYRRHGRRSRRQALVAAVAVGLLSVAIGACGDDESSSESGGTGGTYPVKIVTAEFPAKQRLGETTLLLLGVKNTGRKTMPSLTVTVSVGGEEGRSSSLPFGYHDPSPEVAQPDRPVWALAAGYPKLSGSTARGGTETSNPKTFDFGPLKAGATTEAVWKLSAVRTGDYEVLYSVGAGLDGGKAETAPGTGAGGSFTTQITEVPPNSVVTDSGEVVPAPKDPTEANR